MYKLTENGVTLTQDDGSVLSIPNSEGNRHWRAYQEWLAEGNTPEPQFTQAELDKQAQDKINAEARAYLAETDWMLWRELDGGDPMDPAVKQARAEARARVVE